MATHTSSTSQLAILSSEGPAFLKRVPYNVTSGPWGKCPHLADILHDDPCAPKYNVISDNILCHGPKSITGTIFPGNEAKNNTQC